MNISTLRTHYILNLYIITLITQESIQDHLSISKINRIFNINSFTYKNKNFVKPIYSSFFPQFTQLNICAFLAPNLH